MGTPWAAMTTERRARAKVPRTPATPSRVRTYSVGHEPPLSVAARDGWLIIAERPEHFLCNMRKGVRDDATFLVAEAKVKAGAAVAGI